MAYARRQLGVSGTVSGAGGRDGDRRYLNSTTTLRTRIKPTNPNPSSIFWIGGTEKNNPSDPEVR